jgi:gamma-glutamylcyclotransferase (GGCT)/AIG2-like uncharacterized protein YtfP
MNSILLFVYGTLQRGMSHHHLLNGQEFVRAARTLPRYRLYNCGWFPALVEAADGVAVEGELWRTSQNVLPQLDRYEDAPHLFVRRPIAIDGDEPAFAYIYVGSMDQCRDCGTRWQPTS